jgi:dihydroneopterin aldolase/2-amino-4-hydroxy-6-hydroxymethyldihydropteridine diphosphokinase
MLDRISIVGLRVHGNHGVLPEERTIGQDFVIDAVLWLDASAAAAADDLTLTADYGAIADRLAGIVAGPPVLLIETLADRLAAACLADVIVEEAEVTVHKPQAPVQQPFADIAVTVRRSREMIGQARKQRQHTQDAGAEQHPVVLSLGSNIGDRLASLQLGVDILVAGGLACPVVSSVYETFPVGGPAQDDYLNAVLLAVTNRPALGVLSLAAAAEAAAGRVRTVRFGPRTLDVDVIAYGAETSDEAVLTLPHPRAHERAFVLAPWLELDPAAELPGRGMVAELLAAIGTDGIRRRADLALTVPLQARATAVARCT